MPWHSAADRGAGSITGLRLKRGKAESVLRPATPTHLPAVESRTREASARQAHAGATSRRGRHARPTASPLRKASENPGAQEPFASMVRRWAPRRAKISHPNPGSLPQPPPVPAPLRLCEAVAGALGVSCRVSPGCFLLGVTQDVSCSYRVLRTEKGESVEVSLPARSCYRTQTTADDDAAVPQNGRHGCSAASPIAVRGRREGLQWEEQVGAWLLLSSGSLERRCL